MYLLMLLATFISAIYGYNLSARPDYDRDVPRKKAMSVVYKFLFQERNAVALIGRVNRGEYAPDKVGGAYSIKWALPGDLVYADFSNSEVDEYNKDTTLFYAQKSGGESVEPFYLRKRGVSTTEQGQASKQSLSDNYLEAGRRFYDGSEMVTKVICLDKAMQENGAKSCEPTPMLDPTSGELLGYTETCCNGSFNYVVSYKKLDSRWVNRMHKGISLDFMNAIVDRDYTDNIGVIHWDEDKDCEDTTIGGGDETVKGCWVFQGKINFLPVFAKEMEEWEAAHVREDGRKEYYPNELRDRATWDLPVNIFPKNYFEDKNHNTSKMCEYGCLFKIRMF